MIRYPMMMYRGPDPETWIIVGDENEEREALADGWRLLPWPDAMDADGDGHVGGSVDHWDQKSDEQLRMALQLQEIQVHHRTGRARMLQILREAA